MSANVIPLPTKPRPVEIEVGDRVEHRDSGDVGTVFKIAGRRVSVMCCARQVVADIGKWRLA